VAGAGFVRWKLLTNGEGHTLVAARHNRREIVAERGSAGSIDASRCHLNYSLTGEATAREIAAKGAAMLANAGITSPRKNAGRTMEIVFSLPPAAQIDHRSYFSACVEWAGQQFGGRGNLVAADVHLDEGAPHCHVLLVPLRDGKLSGSLMTGDRANVAKLQTSFFENVAKPFGLNAPAAKLKGAARERLAQIVVKRLQATNDPATRSGLWHVTRDAIERDPAPFALALGIEVTEPAATQRRTTFASVMTSKGKRTSEDKTYRETHENVKPDRESSPVNLSNSYRETQTQKTHSLCSVGNLQPNHSKPGEVERFEEAYTRVRDEDDCASEAVEVPNWPPPELQDFAHSPLD
jgi:Plasmid recombination enzyme